MTKIRAEIDAARCFSADDIFFAVGRQFSSFSSVTEDPVLKILQDFPTKSSLLDPITNMATEGRRCDRSGASLIDVCDQLIPGLLSVEGSLVTQGCSFDSTNQEDRTGS